MLEFLKLVMAECEKQGVKLVLSPDAWVYTSSGSRCQGFFDEESLVVATGRKSWAAVLAHEFGHLQQWQEDLFAFEGKEDPYALLEAWYNGRDYAANRVQAAVQACMACEHDAESRAVGFISRYGLEHRIDEYIARANGYVLAHLWAQKHRRWPFVTDWTKAMPTDRITPIPEVKLTPELEAAISAVNGA